jgi:hypothetical protein
LDWIEAAELNSRSLFRYTMVADNFKTIDMGTLSIVRNFECGSKKNKKKYP